MPRHIIPQFEPEVIAAVANRHWRGNTEKVATTSIREWLVDQIAITSRYRKANELEIMAEMVEGISSNLKVFVESLYCDSKVSACYTITLRQCTKAQAQKIVNEVEAVCFARDNGHNGINVSGAWSAEIEAWASWDFENEQ